MADKIKKFLVDNKGCPLTPQATKQLLVKFIELMSEVGTVKVEASNITALSPEVLDELEVGDVVQKITGKQKHCYIVTYKGDGAGEGICLSYCAAGYMETVSYDRSGSSWVYNSTDVVNLEKLLNGFIKTGQYILDDNANYILVEEIPADYTGSSISIGDDALIYIQMYNNGELIEDAEYSAAGPSKVQPSALVSLTHSFDELDPVLKQIVEDAIGRSGAGVACTQAQWNAIKELLENSLYINYDGTSLIKSLTDGISNYTFGTYIDGTVYGGYIALELRYDDDAKLLMGRIAEV